MRCDWDTRKNRANIRQHGVDFLDVEEMLKRPLRPKRRSNDTGITSDTGHAAPDDGVDEQIDCSDIPELDEEFLRTHTKSMIVPIDFEVVQWLRQQGHSLQPKINQILRAYMESQQKGNSDR